MKSKNKTGEQLGQGENNFHFSKIEIFNFNSLARYKEWKPKRVFDKTTPRVR